MTVIGRAIVVVSAVTMSACAGAAVRAAPAAKPTSSAPPTSAATSTTTTTTAPATTTSTRPATTTTAAPRVRLPRPSGPGSVSVLHVDTGDATTPQRDVWVYRPAVPDSAALPVLYFLHGQPGAPADVFSTGLAGFLDEAFERGMPPFVVAAPDGEGVTHTDSEWADASDGSDRIETFVMSEVIPAVEANHPRAARVRAIAGFSMGGYGAMNLALRHPGVFGQVVSIAGYFHIDDPDGVFAGNAKTQNANAPDHHVAAASALRILLLDGEQDQEPVVRGEAQRFMDLLDDAGIPATLLLTPGDHSWQYVAGQLPAITTFLEGGFGK